MRPRSLVLSFLALIAAVVIVNPAEAHGAKAKGKRLVVSPRAGQVVHWHHVRVRVRSRSLADTLRVRLNGEHLGAHFGRPRRGVRTLRASVSHGLRRGRNVLKVTVRRPDHAPRRATVRFAVRTKRHLVGAGKDRPVAVGGKVRIRGDVRRATRRAAGSKVRWKLVDGPRRSGVRAASVATTTPPASLTSTAGMSAGFRPTVPGQYTVRLTAGSGSQTASDTVTLSAAPRSKLVPIETMTTTDAHSDERGIRVGDTTYLLRDAVDRHQTYPSSVLQALVLHRKTLGFEWNRRYSTASDLGKDLDELDDTDLVIVVMQPGPDESHDYGPLQQAVDRIGTPNYGELPKGPGLISIIGVPRMDPGDADVNVVNPGRLGSMKGYLTPDQYEWFGFVPSERVPFTFEPELSDPCDPGGRNGGQRCEAGFRVRHLDSRTLAPAAHDGEFYKTSWSDREAARMADDLAAFPPENVVMIEAVSTRWPDKADYTPPIGSIRREVMTRLANEVQLLGGTRNAFNRIAQMHGSVASGGLTYALVGWKGATEGVGAEVAAGVDGAGDAPTLSIVVRPDRQSRFRPVASDASPDALAELVLKEPTNAWPLSQECRPAGMRDDDPGANLAFAYLGSANNKIGSDPRAAYTLQPYDKSDWNDRAAEIAKVEYTDVPLSQRRDKFTQVQFIAGRCQLVTELHWVANVRAYLSSLTAPFAATALTSYGHAQKLADDIYKETHTPDDDVAMHWIEFVEILLKFAAPIPEVGEVTETIAGAMELGVWAFGANEDGTPTDDELQFKAHELGDKLQTQLTDAMKTYDSIGDVIVTDSAKLAFLGTNGGCIPTGDADTCPKGYSFTTDDKRRVATNLYRSVEQLAYEELLPLAFRVYGLNPQRRAAAPDPKWYRCSIYPWWYYSPLALSTATTPLLQELDPTASSQNVWKLLVLSRPKGSTVFSRGQAPSDELLRRMFGAVPKPDSPSFDRPEKGGLGISPSRLMRAAKWNLWEEARDDHDRPTGRDNCS
jgi:hypothetical protein